MDTEVITKVYFYDQAKEYNTIILTISATFILGFFMLFFQ